MSILPESAIDAGSVVIVENEEATYRKTYMFDYEKGDFAVDQAGRVREATDGEDILRQLVEKALHDSRYKYLAYSNAWGNEVETALSQDFPRGILQSELKRLYTEALIYHPLIKDVRDFAFEGEDDKMFIEFTVEGIDEIVVQMRREVS